MVAIACETGRTPLVPASQTADARFGGRVSEVGIMQPNAGYADARNLGLWMPTEIVVRIAVEGLGYRPVRSNAEGDLQQKRAGHRGFQPFCLEGAYMAWRLCGLRSCCAYASCSMPSVNSTGDRRTCGAS